MRVGSSDISSDSLTSQLVLWNKFQSHKFSMQFYFYLRVWQSLVVNNNWIMFDYVTLVSECILYEGHIERCITGVIYMLQTSDECSLVWHSISLAVSTPLNLNLQTQANTIKVLNIWVSLVPLLLTIHTYFILTILKTTADRQSQSAAFM